VKRFVFILLLLLALVADLSFASFVKILFFSAVSFWVSTIFFASTLKDPPMKLSFKSFAYFFWLLKEIYMSTLSIINIVLFKKGSNIHPVINVVHTEMKSDMENVIYGNSITITPGTLTMKIDSGSLQVHSISQNHYKSLIKGKMSSKIKESQQ
jgi:multicomponent Na+:H+ antiporter subunit E